MTMGKIVINIYILIWCLLFRIELELEIANWNWNLFSDLGVCEGLGLGLNSQAAIITRGCNEMTKLVRCVSKRSEEKIF